MSSIWLRNEIVALVVISHSNTKVYITEPEKCTAIFPIITVGL